VWKVCFEFKRFVAISPYSPLKDFSNVWEKQRLASTGAAQFSATQKQTGYLERDYTYGKVRVLRPVFNRLITGAFANPD
jgi:hypothetical protein